MFVDAYALAEHFTRPLVISTRRLSGAVESAVATWVLLNADGWFLTAGHVFDVWRGFELHLPEVRAHRAAEAAIAADRSLDADGRQAALERLAGTADPTWIENCSAWRPPGGGRDCPGRSRTRVPREIRSPCDRRAATRPPEPQRKAPCRPARPRRARAGRVGDAVT
jgi:hypothetical protein